MTLVLDGVLSEEFINNFVVKALKLKIASSLSKKDLTSMNEYLKNMFQTDVDSIIKQIDFSINKYNNTWTVSINNNIEEEKSQEKLISMLKLIEYGNLKVKGLNVINNSFKFVKNHIVELYKLYLMKGGK